uniref:Uncharacterized protein n=1 Tax=Tanacetum cinerariifolium TaxID=118510 RepID=A0A699GNZ8_TANCI|nr:hypothetical protein [Tanacetum cinerariifolium]
MTRKLDDMIELSKSQPKRTYNEDLECEIVMVKMPKCMAWLDDEPLGDLDTIKDKAKNPIPQITPYVLPLFEVFSTWMAFEGNTRDLSSFEEETNEITDLHQILEEVFLIEHRDGTASIKLGYRDLFNDCV